jgi:MYXO-CTERM domain-containing protein
MKKSIAAIATAALLTFGGASVAHAQDTTVTEEATNDQGDTGMIGLLGLLGLAGLFGLKRREPDRSEYRDDRMREGASR